MGKRHAFAAMLTAMILLCSCGETKAFVDHSFPKQIQQTGSTALSVTAYETSYAEEHPKNVAQIDGYNTKGVLVEQQINTKSSELAIGLTGFESILNGELYTIASDGVKSKTSSWTYSYDDNGNITEKETVIYTKPDGTVQSDSESTEQIYTIYYTYNTDGNKETETTKTRDNTNAETTVSVVTYTYNEDGSCAGYTLFNSVNNVIQETTFINNTNGKPVKEKTYAASGELIQTIVNSYNSDGTLSYSETQSEKGILQARTSYIYDEQGYLVKTATYQGKNGQLEKNRVYVYQY